MPPSPRAAKQFAFLSLFLISALSIRARDNFLRIAADSLKLSPTLALGHSGRWVALQKDANSVTVFDTSSARKISLHANEPPLSLAWSPDDRLLFITRHSSLTIYEMPTGKLHATLTGSANLSSTDVSPNGLYLSAVRGHNLWLAAVNNTLLQPLTKSENANLLIGEPDPTYAFEFAADRHYWWSPDSSTIAFIETEFASANHYPPPGSKPPLFRLKWIDVASHQVRTITESNEQWPYLLRVAWHPDSRHIAFYRLNRLQNMAELCLFSDTGQQTLLTEKDPYWVNAPASPLFLPDGKTLVVTSERSGARHVYLYTLDGALIRDLTPPGMEVYRLHASLDAKNRIYVTAAEGNKQQQHLFRIDTQNSECTKLTSAGGWHDVTVNPSGTAFVDRYSSSMQPPSIWWHGEDTQPRQLAQLRVSQKAVANEFLPIKTHDSVSLPARLFKPGDFDPQRKYPVILYTFSGPRERVVADSWGGWQMAWNRYMVGKGYLVLAVDTRGSAGYGHLFEEYIHYRFGAQETADLREVVDFLRRQSYVDPHRIGIWGCDYGAHTVVHAMLEFPNGFKAGFADSPITDWRQHNAYFTERYLGLPARHVTEYDDSSPLENARRITGTLLAAASSGNLLIRPAHLAALQEAMNKAKAKHPAIADRLRVLNLPAADYREKPDELAALLAAMTAFFEQTL